LSNPTKRQAVGALGEKLAAGFLRKRGYHIIETNYRCPAGEIDIVARQGETLVFIEVRTKSSQEFGSPEESITSAKKARLRALAAHYAQTHDNLPSQRIDVVSVELDKKGRVSRIEIIENAVGGT
jgi:putative endonuclease